MEEFIIFIILKYQSWRLTDTLTAWQSQRLGDYISDQVRHSNNQWVSKLQFLNHHSFQHKNRNKETHTNEHTPHTNIQTNTHPHSHTHTHTHTETNKQTNRGHTLSLSRCEERTILDQSDFPRYLINYEVRSVRYAV